MEEEEGDEKVKPDINALLIRFTELLVGDAEEEKVEMVKVWALYNHMLKVMPNLVQHWTSTHLEEKAEIRKIFQQIQELNQQNKAQIHNHQSEFNSEHSDKS